MGEKTDKIKKHLKDHKAVYITGGVCLAVGVTAGIVLGRGGIQIAVANPAVMNWKPVANTIQINMTRPGPKSFVVQCLESQKVWPSIRAAAKDLGIPHNIIAEHLKGTHPDAKGLHFVKLSEI